LRYILLSEHMYFPAISPFLSDWVTYIVDVSVYDFSQIPTFYFVILPVDLQ